MNRIIKTTLAPVVILVVVATFVVFTRPQQKVNKFVSDEIKTVQPVTDTKPQLANKTPELIIALVADSHNFSNNLQKALSIAKENQVDFVIHLGDMSAVGTMEELINAKKVLDESGLKYFVLPGDHEYYISEWDGSPSINNFKEVFGGVDDYFIKNDFLFIHEPLYPLGKDTELLKQVRESDIKAVIAGDAHFSSETADPVRSSLKHIVIGALTEERNLQTPRFSLLRLYTDGGYNVEEIVLTNQKLEGRK